MSVNHIDLSLKEIRHYLEGSNINVFGFLDNTKASEFYFVHNLFKMMIFLGQQLCHIFIEGLDSSLKNEKDIADYLKSVKKYFTKDWMDSWVKEEKKECLADIEAKKKQNADKEARGKKRVR